MTQARAGVRLPRARLAALALMSALVYLIEVAILRWKPPSTVVQGAVAVDLVLGLPLLAWVAGVRGRSLATVLLASTTGAASLLPGARLVLRALAAPLEIAVLVVSMRGFRAALRLSSRSDVAEAWERALVATIGDNAVSRVVASEVSALYHATFGFTRAARVTGARPGLVFTLEASRSPALTWGLGLVTVVESALVHAVFVATHPIMTWALTAFGAYAVLWLVGHDRAVRARCIELEPDALMVRVGLRLSARIPWTAIARARSPSASTSTRGRKGYLDAARPSDPNLVLRLREPVTVTTAFGVRRTVRSLGLCVDDPAGLRAAVNRRVQRSR